MGSIDDDLVFSKGFVTCLRSTLVSDVFDVFECDGYELVYDVLVYDVLAYDVLTSVLPGVS